MSAEHLHCRAGHHELQTSWVQVCEHQQLVLQAMQQQEPVLTQQQAVVPLGANLEDDDEWSMLACNGRCSYEHAAHLREGLGAHEEVGAGAGDEVEGVVARLHVLPEVDVGVVEDVGVRVQVVEGLPAR